MTFYAILKAGRKIKIEDRRGTGYDPAEFWLDGGRVFCWGPEWGTMKRDDMSAAQLNAHIKRMIAEGFTIIIE